MQDLGERANGRRAIKRRLERHDVLLIHVATFKNDRAAAGGSLAKARPVVNHLHAGRPARHEHQLFTSLLVVGGGRNAIGKQRTGSVKFTPLQQPVPLLAIDARGALVCRRRLKLGQRIAKMRPGQHFGVQPLFLRFAAVNPQHLQRIKMVLRYLADRSIRLAQAGHQLRQLCGRQSYPAIGPRHGHRAKPRAKQGAQFINRQLPLAIALARAAAKLLRQLPGRLVRRFRAVDPRCLFAGIRLICHRNLLKSRRGAPGTAHSGNSCR